MATQNLFISEMSFNKSIQSVVSAYFYILNVFQILGVGIHNLLQKHNNGSNTEGAKKCIHILRK